MTQAGPAAHRGRGGPSRHRRRPEGRAGRASGRQHRPDGGRGAEVAELYLAEYALEHKRPKVYAMDRWQIEAYVQPRWGKRQVDEVTKLDVRELLEDLASGP